MQNCSVCGGKRWYSKIHPKTGLQQKDNNGKLLWRCYRCGNIQTEPSLSFIPNVYRRDPNILYLDIEVSYSEYLNFGRKVPNRFMRAENIIHEYYIICWAASYLHMDKVWSGCVDVKSAEAWTDKDILQPIRDLMSSADIIAGHNGDAFDIKRLNTRFEKAGLEPVIDKKTIDTLKIARSKLALEANDLDSICGFYGLPLKQKMSNDDWLEIAKTPKKKTLKRFLEYNIGDVKNGKEVLGRMLRLSGKPEYYGTKTSKGIATPPLKG